MSYELGLAAAARACENAEEVTIRHDVDPMTPDDIQGFFNGIVDGVDLAGRTILGVRAETPTFNVLGVERVPGILNAGTWRNVRFVEAALNPIGQPVEIVIAAA